MIRSRQGNASWLVWVALSEYGFGRVLPGGTSIRMKGDASGTTRVSYDGKSVDYGSAEDLLARIRTIERAIAGTARPRPIAGLAGFSRGDAKQDKRRGESLREVCVSIPEKYRTCSLCCFRQVGLPKGGVWNLIGEDRLPEKISSWTLDLEVAKAFKGGVPQEGQGYQGVILCVPPPPGSIIVNLRELYQDPDFLAALEQHKGSIIGYHNRAGRCGTEQSEIVLGVASVTQQDIYSMGGHSSPSDRLVDEAAKLIHGRLATSKEREALMLKVAHIRSEAGPRWLGLEVTQRVVTKMKPHTERLRKIKRLQDAAKQKKAVSKAAFPIVSGHRFSSHPITFGKAGLA